MCRGVVMGGNSHMLQGTTWSSHSYKCIYIYIYSSDPSCDHRSGNWGYSWQNLGIDGVMMNWIRGCHHLPKCLPWSMKVFSLPG